MKTKNVIEEEEDEKIWQDIKDGFVVLIQIFLIAFLDFAKKSITALSYIFPFSYLLRKNRFHYSHKGLMNTWDEIIEINKKSKINFEIKRIFEDQYFYYYIGEFDTKKSQKSILTYTKFLEDKFSQGNVFLCKSPEGFNSINVIKESVT